MAGLPAEPAWRFVSYEDGVLSLRHFDCELRVRFWPEPFIETSLLSAWHWGDSLLSRSGYFETLPEDDASIERDTASGDFLRMRSCGHGTVLPVVGIECVLIDGMPRLVRGNGQLVFDFDLLSQDCDPVWLVDRALDLAVSCIPHGIRKRLPYFECSCWELLVLASECREVADLMRSNEALLFLWLKKVGTDLSKIDDCMREVLRQPQRVQLKQFGFDGSQKWVNLVRKIPAQEMRILEDLTGKELMEVGDPKLIKCLQHRPVVTAFEIVLVGASSIIHWLKSKPDFDRELRLAHRAILSELYRIPRDPRLKLSPRIIALIRDLEKMSMDRTKRVDSTEWRSVALPFPCPVGWDYLDTRDKVYAEGVAQKNCLQDLCTWSNEDYFLFRINHPVRASLRVCRDALGKFVVQECHAKCNAEVSPVHQKCIRDALRDTLAKPINLAALSA